MMYVPVKVRTGGGRKKAGRFFCCVAMAFLTLSATAWALPSRLVLALDGVAYRDLKALQAGVTCTNFWGHTFQRRAFTAEEGYFPVSHMISTFPSASDVAWTDIFGDRPLPGYQRTYYSRGANSEISINGVTTTMEHEHQMDWQVQNGFLRAMGYLFPTYTFRLECYGLNKLFWEAKNQERPYYAYFRATDDAQHLDRNIFRLLCRLDTQLQKMRARYKAQTGRDLEIVILSDHGHNHAGRGIRVQDSPFLKKAGYRVTKSIQGPKDVVLPKVGIESWVELHCQPAETENLARVLYPLEGLDVLAAPVPNQTNCFLVMNAKGARADILWQPSRNAFRYATVNGDPLGYRAAAETLSRNHKLDPDGFGSADDWMAVTITNRYPLALERIVRGLTRGALNPATILISLDNRYITDDWFTQQGSRLVTCRSTHGGLDDLCSDGILLSNFAPTRDTSTDRVAAQFDDFDGVRDFRSEETGAELVTKQELALTRILRSPFDREFPKQPDDGIYLRIWSPQLAEINGHDPIKVAIEKVHRYSTSPGPHQVTLEKAFELPGGAATERVYLLPPDLKLAPSSEYTMTGSAEIKNSVVRIFEMPFRTNPAGLPLAF